MADTPKSDNPTLRPDQGLEFHFEGSPSDKPSIRNPVSVVNRRIRIFGIYLCKTVLYRFYASIVRYVIVKVRNLYTKSALALSVFRFLIPIPGMLHNRIYIPIDRPPAKHLLGFFTASDQPGRIPCPSVRLYDSKLPA